MTTKKVEGLIGLSSAFFAPIAADGQGSATAHPTYGEKVELGSAVKAHLSVTTASLEVYGDNSLEISDEMFVSGNLDTETLLDDLTVDAKIYGATVDETDSSVTDSDTDASAEGCIGYVQEFLTKEKKHVYRGVFYYRATSLKSSIKDEADTRQKEVSFKNKALSWTILKDLTGAWRRRKGGFATQAEAEAWLESLRTGGATAAAAAE